MDYIANFGQFRKKQPVGNYDGTLLFPSVQRNMLIKKYATKLHKKSYIFVSHLYKIKRINCLNY